MKPPSTLNVLDQHGGFTAITTKRDDTLWRPGKLLKGNTTGTLIYYSEYSFYQNNNDVTRAVYKVPGYRFPVCTWFDNQTGKRIA